MKTFLAILLCGATFAVYSAQAMEIQQFDKMDGDDQITYIDMLAQSTQDAARGVEYAKVKRFFMPKQPGETISGMGQFELAMAYARIADLKAVAKNPKTRRLEAEDVMYATIEKNGIALPASFRPAATSFHPKYPLKFTGPVSMQLAQKDLAEAEEWVYRTVDRPHDFRPGSGPMASSQSQNGIAFFVALIALKMAIDTAAGPSSPGDRLPSGSMADQAPQPWWIQNGYNSFHDAVRSICLGAHNGNGSTC